MKGGVGPKVTISTIADDKAGWQVVSFVLHSTLSPYSVSGLGSTFSPANYLQFVVRGIPL